MFVRRKHPKAKHEAEYHARLKTDAKMGSLLLEAEITGKELLGQLKVGAGGGAKYKKQYDYEIQIEKVNDSTKVCLKLKIFSLNITNHLHCSCEAEILI